MRKQEILLLQIYVVSLMIMGFMYVLRLGTLPPQIPLFYSRTDGADTIAPTFYIFLLPLVSTIIVIANIVIYRRLFNHDLFVRKLLYYASATSIAVTTFIFLKIIFLVS